MWHAHNFYPEFLIRNGKVENWQRGGAALEGDAGSQTTDGRPRRGGEAVDYAPDLFTADALKFIRDYHRQPFSLLRPEHPARQQRGRQGWYGGA